MSASGRFEKRGTAGAIIAALFCPICFPKLAVIGAVLGFGVLAPYEGWFSAASQFFLVIAFIGHVIAFKAHRNRWVLALAAVSVAFVLGSLWIHYIEALVYAGLLGMVAATVWSVVLVRRGNRCEAALK